MRGGHRGRLTAYAGTARRRLREGGLGPVPVLLARVLLIAVVSDALTRPGPPPGERA
ncbi:hypothetical protein [Streptomyces humi]